MAKKTYIRPESTQMCSFIDNEYVLAGSNNNNAILPTRDMHPTDLYYDVIGISIGGSATEGGADGQDALAKGCGVIGLWDE